MTWVLSIIWKLSENSSLWRCEILTKAERRMLIYSALHPRRNAATILRRNPCLHRIPYHASQRAVQDKFHTDKHSQYTCYTNTTSLYFVWRALSSGAAGVWLSTCSRRDSYRRTTLWPDVESSCWEYTASTPPWEDRDLWARITQPLHR